MRMIRSVPHTGSGSRKKIGVMSAEVMRSMMSRTSPVAPSKELRRSSRSPDGPHSSRRISVVGTNPLKVWRSGRIG